MSHFLRDSDSRHNKGRYETSVRWNRQKLTYAINMSQCNFVSKTRIPSVKIKFVFQGRSQSDFIEETMFHKCNDNLEGI